MASKVFPAGRVYKIVNSDDALLYVGSTTQTLSKRMSTHRSTAKADERKLYRHMRNIGIHKFQILLLEETGPITRDELRALEHKYICELDTVKNGLNDRYESIKCSHGCDRRLCKECGGSRICEHQKQRQRCKECGGSQICEHQRERAKCKECNLCQFCGVTNTSRHRVTLKHIINFIQY